MNISTLEINFSVSTWKNSPELKLNWIPNPGENSDETNKPIATKR
jgi:hypothetical protein